MAQVFTNAGRALVQSRLNGSGNLPQYLSQGTGAGTSSATDTTLFTEWSQSRVAGTTSVVTTTVTNDTYQVTGTLTATSQAWAVTNAGVFDATTSGNLMMKADFATVNLNTGDSITYTFKWVLA